MSRIVPQNLSNLGNSCTCIFISKITVTHTLRKFANFYVSCMGIKFFMKTLNWFKYKWEKIDSCIDKKRLNLSLEVIWLALVKAGTQFISVQWVAGAWLLEPSQLCLRKLIRRSQEVELAWNLGIMIWGAGILTTMLISTLSRSILCKVPANIFISSHSWEKHV